MEEWKKWKTVKYPNIRLDSHHAEIVDVDTGEVLEDTTIPSMWDQYVDYTVQNRNRLRNFYKDKVIYRNDVGDAFCSTDWSKH